MNILKIAGNKSHAIIKAISAFLLAHSLSPSSLLATGSEGQNTALASQSALNESGQGSFAVFTVEGDFINTGDWMGWVHVGDYPLIYFYTTQTWGYDTGNNWFYLYGGDKIPAGTPGKRSPAYEDFGSFFVRKYVTVTTGPVTYDYDVDTEDWLAWVNTEQHPWVYLYSYQTWAYDAGRNWFYMRR